MTGPVLVTYATKHGSTDEVAESVAETLRETGLEVELAPAGAVEDLAAYGAVVLGTAIHMGRLHADTRLFLRRFREELAARPLAVYGMGPRTTEPGDLDASRSQLTGGLARVPELAPFAVTIFGGVLDPSELRFPFNRMAAVDARDWYAIQTWAALVASHLRQLRAAA
jgi:menaquinone-dependent protoporphyrinogen oxidase